MRNLEEELEKVEWRVVGLSEIHREGVGCTIMENGSLLYYNGGDGVHGGTGFLINSKFRDQEIIKFETFSTRVCVLTLMIKNSKVDLIQVYAPTSSYTDEEMELFYANVQCAVDSSSNVGRKYCIGDFNSKVGWKRKEQCLGNYGYGVRNARGERLIEFAEGNNYRILNTFFNKREEDKWTWISPNGEYRNEIDFVMANKWDNIVDVEVITSIDIQSDHRAVGMRLNWGKKKVKYINEKKRGKKWKAKELIEKGFENKFKTKLAEMGNKLDEINIVNKIMRETVTEIEQGNKVENYNCRNLPNFLKRLMEKRRKLKKTGKDRIEYVEVCKIIRKELNEWLQKQKLAKIEEAIEKGGKLKDKTGPKDIIVALNDREGKELKEKDAIMNRVKEYYEEIYKGPNSKEIEEKMLGEWEDSQMILKEEVEWAIKNTKEGKACGMDMVTMEMIKAGGETVVGILTEIYNECMRRGSLPDEWYLAKLVILYKKGNRKELKNYRPLSLLCVEYKILSKIITKRLDNYFENFITSDQAGFRSNFSTIDHIFLLNQIISKSKEYSFGFFCLFIDYEKAFDFVTTESVINMLWERQVHPKIINILLNIYKNSAMIFELEGKRVKINVRRGVKQGDVVSSKLFIGVLQKILNSIEWGERGISIEGQYLNKLEFADDVVIIGKNMSELREMLEVLNEECKKFGMKMNGEKCKIMKFGVGEEIETNIEIDGKVVKEENEFIYLGQMLSNEGQWPEICRRCSIGWRAMGRYKYVFKSKLSMEIKRRLWEMTVLPTITYGCETWIMETRVRNKLRVTVRGMERYMLGKTRRDRVRNSWVRKNTGFKDIVKVIMKRKWKWAGHIIRGKDRWTKRVMEWCPREFKRDRGRPRDRWDKEMRLVCGGATWRRVAEQRREWKRMGEVYREVWLPQEDV